LLYSFEAAYVCNVFKTLSELFWAKEWVAAPNAITIEIISEVKATTTFLIILVFIELSPFVKTGCQVKALLHKKIKKLHQINFKSLSIMRQKQICDKI
jgi:hypothetical protein